MDLRSEADAGGEGTFVDETARSSGAGAALIDGLKRHAANIGAPCINWTVLATNETAKHFYRREGGSHDATWEPWTMPIGRSRR
ncbi:GNAT family N-acetyltransferase [Ensifer adhaerens]|uniref:GNAT family N-acetyltransferase n=1 Tax=Ensifer adhaerens TaxID=106592 RepID=UPI001CC168D0|nr:GNAT family N-acetyltransferase [Ensifer adhaerens]